MNKPKPINVICAALFIGTLLSFAGYFGISVLMDASPAAEETVSAGTSAVYNLPFDGFSDSYYDSEKLANFIGSCEYLLFGSVGSSDIILGGNNFLFYAGADEGGYNYLQDYLGIGQFTSHELQAFASIINQRRLAYKNNGAEYLLVVIPNSQTVYSEYMPSYIGSEIGGTRLTQLTEYLAEYGLDCFFNSTELLILAKNGGEQLYNNTENSLNSLGEWYLYNAVCQRLYELYGTLGYRVALDSLPIISYTDGKELARRAGLSSVIKNKTISLPSSAAVKYTSANYYGSMTRTTMSSEYDIGGISANILFEFTDDWDRIQLMPYFSDTYSSVTYKSSHQFSNLIVQNLKPTVVVQFIHEYELYDIISDSNLNLTYNSALKLESDPTVTAAPIIISQAQTSKTKVVIVGRTENSSEGKTIISASGDNIEVTNQYAIDSLFFIEVDVGDSSSATVYITARVIGKTESKALPLRVTLSEGFKEKSVAVGDNSQLFSLDYSNLIFLSDSHLETIKTELRLRLEKIRELSGKDTEYLYVIVPDKLAVYYEDAPSTLDELAMMVENYKAMATAVREGAGMRVLDLTEEMRSHKVLGRLYYQTGTLWTDLGAYVGYNYLMSAIKEISEYEIINLGGYISTVIENIGGELVTRLGIDNAVISESCLELTPSYTSKCHIEYSGDGNFDITGAFISYNEDSMLPVAIVTRDAYGTEMLTAMSENFSKMIVMAENEYTIPNELIATVKPDYIITIRSNGELS